MKYFVPLLKHILDIIVIKHKGNKLKISILLLRRYSDLKFEVTIALEILAVNLIDGIYLSLGKKKKEVRYT